MEPSFYFYTILAALGYLLIESLFMVGVWISAKGETEKMPNGKDYDSNFVAFINLLNERIKRIDQK
ncbi:hypothetical protein [Cellulophaga omnivescoria]|uniref:hypothetical protein n=1 Tax=Cellulophaga omnivescoria TaxID=1888890 RepID=UPI001C0E58F7|nr:hypothetical protein [Cellulophaga omnivescoria]